MALGHCRGGCRPSTSVRAWRSAWVGGVRGVALIVVVVCGTDDTAYTLARGFIHALLLKHKPKTKVSGCKQLAIDDSYNARWVVWWKLQLETIYRRWSDVWDWKWNGKGRGQSRRLRWAARWRCVTRTRRQEIISDSHCNGDGDGYPTAGGEEKVLVK